MTQPIRILLADDHAILRTGLKLLLSAQPNWQVVGEAQNGQEALELARQLQPDILLLDLNMPVLDGLSAIPAIKSAAPQTAILILTMHDDGDYLRRAIQAGASGYVLKKVVDTELLIAIQAVLRGEIYVQSAMTHYLIGSVAPATSHTDPWQKLSEREYEVLKRVALGYTSVEIAEELFLSAKTVETYRARGMEKLNLQTRAQLVKSALEHGHLD